MTKTTTKTRTTMKTQAKRRQDAATPPADRQPSKLDRLVELLKRPEGATVAEMMTAVGWQAHSVRGAMAGALKRRGLKILSEKVDGERRYRIEAGA